MDDKTLRICDCLSAGRLVLKCVVDLHANYIHKTGFLYSLAEQFYANALSALKVKTIHSIN